MSSPQTRTSQSTSLGGAVAPTEPTIAWFEDLDMEDLGRVGGKNASLGRMTRALSERGVDVPGGFAVTAEGWRRFLQANQLAAPLRKMLADHELGRVPLVDTGRAIRRLLRQAPIPPDVLEPLVVAYRELSHRAGGEAIPVAVRSSATAEDLPEASFAGQQESFLYIQGEAALIQACRACYASLFTDRAIAYRERLGFDHMMVALSVGVQRMVRSDTGSAGVIFTLDTDSGFPDFVLVTSNHGLGETVVQGTVDPDEYRVFKPLLDAPGRRPIVARRRGSKLKKMVRSTTTDHPTALVDTSPEERIGWSLSDEEVLELARQAVVIEDLYGRPMDIEWAKDGPTGQLFIVQARPETVHSRARPSGLVTSKLLERGRVLLEGMAVGSTIAAGPAFVLRSLEEAPRFEAGGLLVTTNTDPDWVPVMQKAAGIITDEGGRTSHAAIVSRELGVPAVVGTHRATQVLEDGVEATLSCAEGEVGRVYAGRLRFEETETDISNLPDTRTKIMMNAGSADAALRWWALPCDGVGLARMEFIISHDIRIHPLALLRYDALEGVAARAEIDRLTAGYPDRVEYFVDKLARGMATLAAARYPDPVIVRTSDFKSNEYASLVGGQQFEPGEENPMLGYRGASRYTGGSYEEAFALECMALRRARQELGLDNIQVMIPFCRTPEEGARVLEVMASHGLARGQDGLRVLVMAEIPANIILAEDFAQLFDGFSIGSNDLTQLVLGVDRDSAALAHLFDARNKAVKMMIADLIERAHAVGTTVGICGQAPSDHPDFAAWLVKLGIDSISVNPDSLAQVRRVVARAESTLESPI